MSLNTETEVNYSELLNTIIRYKWIFIIIFSAFLAFATNRLVNPDFTYQFSSTLSISQLSTQDFLNLSQINENANPLTAANNTLSTPAIAYQFPDITFTAQGKKTDFKQFVSLVNNEKNYLANQVKEISSPKTATPLQTEPLSQAKALNILLAAEEQQKALLEKMISLNIHSNTPTSNNKNLPVSFETIKSTNNLMSLTKLAEQNSNFINSLTTLSEALISVNAKINDLKAKIGEQPINATTSIPIITMTSAPKMEALANQIEGKGWFSLTAVLGVCFGLIGVFTFDEAHKLYERIVSTRKQVALFQETNKEAPSR